MRVFMTGASGFIGSYLVPELIGAGHRVTGLSRTQTGVEALAQAGAQAVLGDVNDLERLRAAAQDADAVVHAAFNHDFGNLKAHSEADRAVITALGEALLGSDRPLIVTSGTGLADRANSGGRPAAETDDPVGTAVTPRAATEEAAAALAERGARVIVMRLPQVHDRRRQGRLAEHIRLARRKGWVAYVGDGANRLAAAHVSDVAPLYRLALENGRAGARYHAVGEEGVAMTDIAEVIGLGLGLPVRAIAAEEAGEYFGPIAGLAALDLAASSALTRQELGWRPQGPDLLSDLRAADWSAA
jgi:nucleoside-diphosphate-sugar epimerase